MAGSFFENIKIQQIKSGFVFIIGFLLSPLCWWNDLIFNLPISYGFSKIISYFAADLLIPGAIFADWVSNILGIVLMQFGAVTFFNKPSAEQNLLKNTFLGVFSSTVFTLIIIILWKANLLDFAIPS